MNRHYISNRSLVKYEKEQGKLRMSGGAWTINVDEIKLDNVDKFIYITEGYKYEISKVDAIDFGYFKQLGGENKLVVPLTKWTKRSK